MSFVVACRCGKQLQVNDELAGKRVQCPACQELFVVPIPGGASSPTHVDPQTTAQPQPLLGQQGYPQQPAPQQHYPQSPYPQSPFPQQAFPQQGYVQPPGQVGPGVYAQGGYPPAGASPAVWADTGEKRPKNGLNAVLLAGGIISGVGLLLALIVGVVVWSSSGSDDSPRDVKEEMGQRIASPRNTPNTRRRSQAAANQSPLTQVETAQYGQAVQDAFRLGESTSLRPLVDYDALVSTAFAGLMVEDRREAFSMAVRGAVYDSGSPLVIFLNDPRRDARLLRVRKIDGRQRALFRMIAPDSLDPHYEDWVLHRFFDGNIRAVDIMDYSTGEFISQTLRRAWLRFADKSRRDMGRLTSEETEYVNNLGWLGDLQAAARSGPNKAIEEYHSLPPKVQTTKSMLNFRLKVARKAGVEEFLRAAADYRKHHPGDQAYLGLSSIEFFTAQQQYDQALESVNQVEQAIGGDPYLDAARACIHLSAEKYSQSQTAVQKCLDADAKILAAHVVKIMVLLKQEDFAQLLEQLKSIHANFSIQWDGLFGQPEFAKFIEAPQYSQWLDHVQQGGQQPNARPMRIVAFFENKPKGKTENKPENQTPDSDANSNS